MSADVNEIATTILAQLGGSGRLAAMLGAHSFLTISEGVQFGIRAKATNKANKIVIKLDPSDTYKIEFWSVRGMNCKLISSYAGGHVEDLRPWIESATGLRLSL